MPAIPELTEPLGDGAVTLRLAAERDIPEILIAYQDDPELHLRLSEQRPPSGAQLGGRQERAAAARAAGTEVRLTILAPGSDDCWGQIFAKDFHWEHRRAELGIWLSPRARGRGLAKRSLRLAAAWLFDACGFERAQLLTHPDNQPMLRAARAAGFQEEGVLRGYERGRGGRVDLAILSLLSSDLPR